MDDLLIYEVISQGLRVLFILGLPVVAVVSVVATIVAVFQAATTLHELTLAYAAKLVALVVVLYMLFPLYSRSLLRLAELAWSGTS